MAHDSMSRSAVSTKTEPTNNGRAANRLAERTFCFWQRSPMPPIPGSWVNRKTVTGPVQGNSLSADYSKPLPTDWVGGDNADQDIFLIFRSKTEFPTCSFRTYSPVPRCYGKRPTPVSIPCRSSCPINRRAIRSDSWIPGS